MARITSNRSKSPDSTARAMEVTSTPLFLPHPARAGISRLALVPAVGPRRVDLEVGPELGLLDEVSEDGFAERRAADVARADEEDARHEAQSVNTPRERRFKARARQAAAET